MRCAGRADRARRAIVPRRLARAALLIAAVVPAAVAIAAEPAATSAVGPASGPPPSATATRPSPSDAAAGASASDAADDPSTPGPAALARYRAGVAALDDHRYEEARRALLDTVALAPDFAGAWLDLALATAGTGDLVQAEEFLAILETRFTPPPALAQAIADLRTRLARASVMAAAPAVDPGAGWHWSGAAQAGLGFDDNANAGLALGSITLTLPGGLLELPLSGTLRPRSDGFVLASVAAAATRRFGDDRVDLTLSVRGRRNFSETGFDTLDLRARAAWTLDAAQVEDGVDTRGGGPWSFALAQQFLRLGGHALASSTALSAERAWPMLPCRPVAGGELDIRSYPVASTLDAAVLWFGVTAHCPGLVRAPGGSALGVQARVGHAFARHGPGGERARPGGDTRHIELGVSHEWRWGVKAGQRTLQAQLLWERAADTRGYSPLLDWNRRRTVSRTVAGLAWTTPFGVVAGHPVELIAAAQWYRQRSSLELFRLTGQIYQLAWRIHW